MGKIYFDFWCGHSKKDVAFVTVYFSDADCLYRGNAYDKNKRCIADFWSCDSVAIEKAFPGIFGN